MQAWLTRILFRLQPDGADLLQSELASQEGGTALAPLYNLNGMCLSECHNRLAG